MKFKVFLYEWGHEMSLPELETALNTTQFLPRKTDYLILKDSKTKVIKSGEDSGLCLYQEAVRVKNVSINLFANIAEIVIDSREVNLSY